MIRSVLVASAVITLAACSQGEPGTNQEPASAPADAAAPAPAEQTLRVENARVRASLNGAPNTGGWLTISNPGPNADRLVGAACDCAGEVQMHTMSVDGQMMRMAQVEGFDIPAGGALTLQPGGDHLMFLGLTSPLEAGSAVEATLTFESGLTLPVRFDVVQDPSTPQ